MSIRFSGRRFASRLRKSAGPLEAGDDKYDRILQSILTTVGVQENEGYESAAQTVDKLSASNITRTVNRVIVTGTGVAVVAAAVFSFGFFGRYLDAPPDEEAFVEIGDEGVPLHYGISPQQPQAVYVPDEAAALPTLDSFRVDDRYIYIYLAGHSDDQEWIDRLYGVNADGARVAPVDVDSEEGMVKFELPTDRFALCYEDADGNRARIPLQLD